MRGGPTLKGGGPRGGGKNMQGIAIMDEEATDLFKGGVVVRVDQQGQFHHGIVCSGESTWKSPNTGGKKRGMKGKIALTEGKIRGGKMYHSNQSP